MVSGVDSSALGACSFSASLKKLAWSCRTYRIATLLAIFLAVLPEILSHGDGMVGKTWGGLSLTAIQTVKTIDIAGFFWDF